MLPNAASGCRRYSLLMPGFFARWLYWWLEYTTFCFKICQSFLKFYHEFPWVWVSWCLSFLEFEFPGVCCNCLEHPWGPWSFLEHLWVSWNFLESNGVFWNFLQFWTRKNISTLINLVPATSKQVAQKLSWWCSNPHSSMITILLIVQRFFD